MTPLRAALIWACLAVAVVAPIVLAAMSDLLQWRDPIYIAGGFAGIVAMALVLLQPLLAGGYLPGISPVAGRRLHRWVGCGIVAAVVAHVAGLWVASPPDVVDVLLLRSPTPFSVWGLAAMWATFAAGLLAAVRVPLRIHPKTWRLSHSTLVVIIVIGGVIHALLIEGAMEGVSKAFLSALALAATAKVLWDMRAWKLLARRTTNRVD